MYTENQEYSTRGVYVKDLVLNDRIALSRRKDKEELAKDDAHLNRHYHNDHYHYKYQRGVKHE